MRTGDQNSDLRIWLGMLDSESTRPLRRGALRIATRMTATRMTATVMAAALLAAGACSTGAAPGTAPTVPSGSANAAATVPLDREARIDLAADAFVFGAPLVITRRTIAQFAGNGPLNQLLRAPNLATPKTQAVVAPNRDTLYLVASMDVSQQPQILTVPEVTDRYFEIQLIDAYTDVHLYLGTRATRGRAGTYAIVAPGWKGTLPSGVEELRLTTPQAVLLGRVRAKEDEDLTRAHEIQIATTLVPLDMFTKAADPKPQPTIAKAPGAPQAILDAGVSFFDELSDGLAANPATSDAQRALVERLAGLGIAPGKKPSADITDADQRMVLEAGMRRGQERIDSARSEFENSATNGWTNRTDLGRYGDNLLQRAAVAQLGWGANGPEEALYPSSTREASGAPYSGAERYIIHFPAAGLPPVEPLGFWSITIYGPDRYLVENPINRWAIGGDTPGLVRNGDGSLDLYIQRDAPLGHESNWLPSPAGEFTLNMRIYLPGAAAAAGTYEFPAVTKQP